MIPQAFAAARRERMVAADDELRSLVEAALRDYGSGVLDWAVPIEEATAVLWLEMFDAEAPSADPDPFMPAFRRLILSSLEKTSQPGVEPEPAQIDRVTRWLSTMAVNAGTIQGARVRGVRFKRWASMDDAHVRPEHMRVDGQVVPIGGTFEVGGYALHYPGEPVGPPDTYINCRCIAQPAALRGDSTMSDTTTTIDLGRRDRLKEQLALIANAAEPQDPSTYTGMVVVLKPAADDPVVAASSEPAHLSLVWLGEADARDANTISQITSEVEAYASTLEGPIVVPVRERGTLGEDDADVAFLEPTESLIALRDGFLAASPAIKETMDSVEQFPEWTPHVTLGYPETPAAADFTGESITFDSLSLWVAGEHYDFPMGGGIDSDMPEDDLEDDEEEITEIPVHGVAVVEGVKTGDNREFKRGALTFREPGNGGSMPIRLEIVGTHGGDTSQVVVVGRIDEIWRQEGEDYNEIRYRGAVSLTGEYGSRVIDGIVDGSLTGVSIESDSIVVDPEHEAAQKKIFERSVGEDGEVELTAEEKALIRHTVFSEARVCGFTIVPIPAFQEAYIALGHEFADEMTEEQLTAAAAALEDCGCGSEEYALAAVASDAEAFRDVDAEERKRLAKSGEAMPDGSFPIANEDDLRNAIQAIGRAKDPAKAKAHIKKRARALDREDLIPDGWSSAGESFGSFAPGTKDGPGWITHPVPTARIRRYWVSGKGAAKIGWGRGGDFYRCRRQLRKYVQNPDWLSGLCANLHKEALGIWPGQHDAHSARREALVASGAEPAPILTLVASASTVYPSSAFEEPADEGRAFAMRIDREKRTITGYAAEWGACHIGIQGVCREAPHSSTNYRFFRKGVVETDAGEQEVGLITYGIGHASTRVSAAAATAHYDRTDAVRAYINIGENRYGIWYSGVLAPWVTNEDIDAMMAIRRVSGDWRSWSGRSNDLEMVGLVVVNTEGYQLAASGGVQTAAIGIGVVDPDEESLAASAADADEREENEAFVARIAAKAIEMHETTTRAEAARSRLAALRANDARRALIERI